MAASAFDSNQMLRRLTWLLGSVNTCLQCGIRRRHEAHAVLCGKGLAALPKPHRFAIPARASCYVGQMSPSSRHEFSPGGRG